MIKPVAVGGAFYWMGFEADIVYQPLALMVMITCSFVIVQDLWRDPVDNRMIRAFENLARRLEERLDEDEVDRIVRQVTSRNSDLEPGVILGQVLKDDDRQWLLEQTKITTKEYLR